MRKSLRVLMGLMLVTSSLLVACARPTSSPTTPSTPAVAPTPESIPVPTVSPTGNGTAPLITTTASSPSPSPAVVPTSAPATIPAPVPPSEPLYGWAFEGEIMRGVADASVVTLPDGGYRMYFGSFNDWSGDFPNKPYIGSATSKDGLIWTSEGDRGLVGGWPRVKRLPDGRYRLYYGGSPGIAAAVSADGLTWQKETLTGFEPSQRGIREYGGLDIVLLGDGSYRLYYSEQIPSPQFTMTGVSHILSAVSKDALNWQPEPGIRIDWSAQLEGPAVNHPRVITLATGGYKMFYWTADNLIWSATSRDGLTWENRQRENIWGADPDIVMLPDGRLRMYVNMLNASMFGRGIDAQRMFSYVWGTIPYTLSALGELSVRRGQSVTTDINVEGTAGKKVSLSLTPILFGGDPPDVSLSQTSVTAPSTVGLTVSAKSSTVGFTLVVTGNDGMVQTQAVIPVRVTP